MFVAVTAVGTATATISTRVVSRSQGEKAKRILPVSGAGQEKRLDVAR